MVASPVLSTADPLSPLCAPPRNLSIVRSLKFSLHDRVFRVVQMLGHKLTSLGRIARLQCVDQRQMFQGAGTAALGNAPGVENVRTASQIADYRRQQLVLRGCGDREMNQFVHFPVFGSGRVGAFHQLLDRSAHGRQCGIADAAGREPRGLDFKELADFENFHKIRHRDLEHGGQPAQLAYDQTLGFELFQGLAHRGAGDIQRFRQLTLL